MAALATFSGLSALEEIVPTEEIEGFIAGYQYPMPVAMSIAWVRPGQGGSTPVKFPRFNAITPTAGTKSETDTFGDASVDMAEGSGTPGLVGFRMPISDDVAAGAVAGVPAGILADAMRALVNRMDIDLCAISTGSTNATGAITDTFTLAKLRSALAAYKALEVPNSPLGHALVLDHGPAAALFESAHSTAGANPLSTGDSLNLGPMSGRIGRAYGVEIFEDLNVAAESTGRSNFMTPIGSTYSGLGLALSELPSVEQSRGDDAVNRAVSYYVFRAWYAACMANQTRFLEVLSLA